MVTQSLRLIFAVLAMTLLFNVSASASDEQKSPKYFPGDFEIARRKKDLAAADQELVDNVLGITMNILDLGNKEQLPVFDAADCLQWLMNIHDAHPIGANERKEKLKELRATAQKFYLNHVARPKNFEQFEPEDLIDALDANETVKSFIRQYFAGSRENKRFMVQGTAAVGGGFNAGCGLGTTNFLSGDQCLTLCLSVGCSFGFGADATLEPSQDVTDSCLSSFWRFHWSRILSLVADVVDAQKIHGGYRYFLKSPSRVSGVGCGEIEVFSGMVSLPLIPLPPNYAFARKLLRITY